jgi:hypothetical protein
VIPEVLAYPLDEARRLLEGEGVEARVTETHPPGGVVPAGALRVIRQRAEDGRVLLVVTHERYERPAPAAATPIAPPPEPHP